MAKLDTIVLPIVSDNRFSNIDPLDSRYFDADSARYLSEQSRVAYQAHVEAALAQVLAEFGVCSQAVADEITASAANAKISDIAEEEKTTKHDVKALVNTIKKSISDEAKPFVHFGATSYDIVSTAYSLQMKTATHELVMPRLKELISILVGLTEKYAQTTQIGRTHGQHGVPITFGFAMAEYVARLSDSYQKLEVLAKDLRGKFSGAVGAYNALDVFVDDPLGFEQSIMDVLGLQAAPHSNQVVPAEAMVRLIDELAVTAGIMANLGHDMRNLQRSEINEVREFFAEGQTGSSTMAHKRNPWNFENVVGMSKQVFAQTINAKMNISTEHQRDLTDSASARFYPVVFASVAAMTSRLSKIMSKIEVDELAMQRNLKMSGGAIAAEPLYLLFEKHGHTKAHEKSKALSHQALAESRSLAEVVSSDAEGSEYWNKFTDTEKAIIESPEQNYSGRAADKANAIAHSARETLDIH